MHSNNMTAPTAVNIPTSGGVSCAASVWLNENYLGAQDTTNRTNNNSFPVTADMFAWSCKSLLSCFQVSLTFDAIAVT